MQNQFIQSLSERGLIAQISHPEELKQTLDNTENGKPYAIYCGVDPTAPSLHLGNLAALMNLRRAQDHGLVPIVLFGGATGLIGDPTGRTEMRPMSTSEQIASYIANFEKLMQRYFRFDVPNKPIFVNNIDWFGGMSWLDFARNIGVHFTIARLLSAEVNRTRFEEGGLTYMELGYQLLQAFDFLHLFKNHNCIMQVGGDDQWSNILAGADLIRRMGLGKAFALTTPLLVGSDGKKFGKTAGNAIWLDENMCSPYHFFQFFRNRPDNEVEKMLRVFTTLSCAEINVVMDVENINTAKEKMAYIITANVHGTDAADAAQHSARALFSKGGAEFVEGSPVFEVSRDELMSGMDILNLCVACELTKSKGEARKLIEGNGLTLNGEKISETHYKLTMSDFDESTLSATLRKGKKDFRVIRVI